MTKSSVRKAAAENARSKYRKITRKVGTGKAQSSERKTASKAVAKRARGTYRKSAARFEEFAYDAQMPELIAPSPRRAWLIRASFMCTLSKLY